MLKSCAIEASLRSFMLRCLVNIDEMPLSNPAAAENSFLHSQRTHMLRMPRIFRASGSNPSPSGLGSPQIGVNAKIQSNLILNSPSRVGSVGFSTMSRASSHLPLKWSIGHSHHLDMLMLTYSIGSTDVSGDYLVVQEV